jgi:hypothetical protein
MFRLVIYKCIALRKTRFIAEFPVFLSVKSIFSALHKKAPKNFVKKQKSLLTIQGTFVILLERLCAGTGRAMR